MGELLEFAASFLGRFSRSVLVVIAFAIWMLSLTMLCEQRRIHSHGYHLGLALFATAVDFALTFVPSALAFTTRSARRALRIGFQLIRQRSASI